MDLAAMHDPELLAAAIGALLLLGLMSFLGRRWSLARSADKPLPEQWVGWVRTAVPFYTRLPKQAQKQLQRQIRQFLWQKRFIGCGGLSITDTMKVTVAAHACALSLSTQKWPFNGVRWVYIYPAELALRHSVAHAVLPHPGRKTRSDWVLLAWDERSQSIFDFNGGRNAALHELIERAQASAHSREPLLHSRGAYGTWAILLSRSNPVEAHPYFGQPALVKEYGATSATELFAVATESFFSEPEAMASEHKELFEETRKLLQVHPAAWRTVRNPSVTD